MSNCSLNSCTKTSCTAHLSWDHIIMITIQVVPQHPPKPSTNSHQPHESKQIIDISVAKLCWRVWWTCCPLRLRCSWAEPPYCKHKTSLISPHSVRVTPSAQMNVSVFELYNLGCHWSIVRGLPNALGILKMWWFQSDSSNIFQHPALVSSRHEPSSSHLSNPRWPSDLEVESMKQTWLDSKSETNSVGSHLRSSHMQTIAVGFPDKLLESRYSIAGTCHIARRGYFSPTIAFFFL